VKFSMRVGLLSAQVFSRFGELWLAGRHGGGGITSGMNSCGDQQTKSAVGIGGGGVA